MYAGQTTVELYLEQLLPQCDAGKNYSESSKIILATNQPSN